MHTVHCVCISPHACFLPTTCASFHVGLKEKAVVVESHKEEEEEAAATAKTHEHEPTEEGNTYVQIDHCRHMSMGRRT